ncbi:OmpP1/FadL family transporter [Flammeovirga aprica]|uniref:Long-chain fatty acid transporter permease n=1 Tax=Flammeovirga aprica JL-4 TaxID=694437 RepID=A0A7X9P1G3_9BACT|nr:outer membrane protein transport protein [Flammeovirga aprica]NME67690.1 long-chain fatty acid transporter permease [Flammeovirga aprica JL-4]
MKLRNLLLSLAAVCIAQASFANGFQVLLQGTKQTGRGNVGVGYGPDASSLFFNPGALSFLESSAIQVGFSPVFSNISYRGIESAEKNSSTSPMGTPFHAYGVYRPSAESPWAFGLGVYTPFGSTVTYDPDWVGKFALQEIALQSIFIQPTASYRIGDKVSVGAGVSIVTGSVQFKKVLSAPAGDITFEMDSQAETKVGFNVGVFAELSEKFSLGASYRAGVDMEVKNGEATFDMPSNAVREILFPEAKWGGNYTDNGYKTDFNAKLPLPSNIGIGVGYNATEKLSFALDFNYVTWSVYEELKIEFPQGDYLNDDGQAEIKYARKWQDSYIINFGVEHRTTEALTIRAGAYYDTTPVQDGYLTPESPDANALGLTIGASYMIGDHFGVDAAFLYVNKEQRQNEVPDGVDTGAMDGIYKATAYIPTVSLNYTF